MDVNFKLKKLVLQPTSLCNLNCKYCYLPNRQNNLRMSPAVTTIVAEGLECLNQEVTIVWHGGEPLSCGIGLFEELIQPFNTLENSGKVKHSIQTNATLINKDWCELFKSHHVKIGVSLDGPIQSNINRLDWRAKESFSRTIKGVNFLKSTNIDFYVIAVVTEESLGSAKELYEFFCELGCYSIGINIEEREGANKTREICDDSRVTQFWKDLFNAWRVKPTIRIREFDFVLSWMKAICLDQIDIKSSTYGLDVFPTIGWNGDVVVLSPELLGTQCLHYDDFIVGNVNKESLPQIIRRAESAKYVTDFSVGLRKCKESCNYFSFCGGGQASNKFFELKYTNGTETTYCRNSKMRLVDAVLSLI